MSGAWAPLPPELGHGRFSEFFCYILRELNLADTPTKQQLRVCDWMENGPSRQVTIAFRGLGKSYICGAVNLHALALDPFEERVLVVGSTREMAKQVTQFMARCIRDIDILKPLEPTGDRQSLEAFDVGPARIDQSPSCRAEGILAPGLTGKRCTQATVDDVETLANSITPLKQARLAAAFTEIGNIIKPRKADQTLEKRIRVLGTPHYETSLYLELIRNRGYKARYWPARYPDVFDDQAVACYENSLDPYMVEEVENDRTLIGQPTDPERFPEDELQLRRGENTAASWQLQFMLNCRLSTLEKYPLRLGDLIVMPLDAKNLPATVSWTNHPNSRIESLSCPGLGWDRYYHNPGATAGLVPQDETWRCVMAIDPAGRGHDELAWAVVAELNGNMFLLESGGTRDGYEEPVLKHLARMMIKWNVTHVRAESNFGDGMFGALLQPVVMREYDDARRLGRIPSDRQGVSIEEERSRGQKEMRIIDVLAPVIQQHRLVVAQDVLERSWDEAEMDPASGHPRSLPYQISRITQERQCLEYYDRIDALAIACGYWTEAAAQDQRKAKQQREDELEMANLMAWMDETGSNIDALALGIRPKANRRAVGGVRRPLQAR